MKITLLLAATLLAAAGPLTHGQDAGQAGDAPGLADAKLTIQRQLDESLSELAALRQRIADETLPLSGKLRDLEGELSKVRLEYQAATRLLDTRTLELGNIRQDLKEHEDLATYLSNLFGEYGRNFESRLHIAELQRHGDLLSTARLASENSSLSDREVFEAQLGLLSAALERQHDALSGTRFDGTAVDGDGLVHEGTFVLVGPAALFRSRDGRVVGTAEQRLGSLEPAVMAFKDPADTAAAASLVAGTGGAFPLDPSLGDAHMIAETEETLWEHIQKGGPVMFPILGMAAAAMLVVLIKWISIASLRRPAKPQVEALMAAVGRGDDESARTTASAMKGPVGAMLAAGAQHLGQPRELIEEVMYESMLTTRPRLERMLPFVAICATSAPLLGLLGTVTGIINTFTLITVFGSGDVKTLSSGISEALITTEFGLIAAIPSLLLHAFLSRKVRGVIGQMEAAAVGFLNQVGRAAAARAEAGPVLPDPALIRALVKDVMSEILGPGPGPGIAPTPPADPAARRLRGAGAS